MAKWICWYTTTASTSFTVEADDHDGALAAAERHEVEHGLPGLCAQCSGWGRPGVDLGEWQPADETFGPNIERVEE